ncbi:MAG: hypothetical protein WBA67_11750, partial [Jannaschia sp.]
MAANFETRTAAYPDAVKAALRAAVTPDLLRDYLALLHADGDLPQDRIDVLMARPMTADALLSRLMLSKKFRLRSHEALDRLTPKASPGGIEATLMGFLLPLTDPDGPHAHKMREICGQEGT